MVAQGITAELEGTVSRVNGHGFQLCNREGWLNISKFSQPAPALPVEGARVRVGLDRAGFVRSVETVVAEHGADERDQQPDDHVVGGAVDKDLRITRLACLNTATAVLSSGGQPADLTEVVHCAAVLERWVKR